MYIYHTPIAAKCMQFLSSYTGHSIIIVHLLVKQELVSQLWKRIIKFKFKVFRDFLCSFLRHIKKCFRYTTIWLARTIERIATGIIFRILHGVQQPFLGTKPSTFQLVCKRICNRVSGSSVLVKAMF